jgi:hypothetical protein
VIEEASKPSTAWVSSAGLKGACVVIVAQDSGESAWIPLLMFCTEDNTLEGTLSVDDSRPYPVVTESSIEACFTLDAHSALPPWASIASKVGVSAKYGVAFDDMAEDCRRGVARGSGLVNTRLPNG